jgi:hypothetical protein
MALEYLDADIFSFLAGRRGLQIIQVTSLNWLGWVSYIVLLKRLFLSDAPLMIGQALAVDGGMTC